MGVVTVISKWKHSYQTDFRMAFLSEFTNEIYDQGNAAFQDQGDTTKVFLGVLVTLLPKIIPRIMPAILGDARIKKKFEDQEYLDTVEHMFREKFIENLSIFENLVVAWKDNSIHEHLGFDSDTYENSILAREDIVVGEPDSFQNELLRGIHFLKARMSKSLARENDPINNVANTIWSTANMIYELVSTYFNSN